MDDNIRNYQFCLDFTLTREPGCPGGPVGPVLPSAPCENKRNVILMTKYIKENQTFVSTHSTAQFLLNAVRFTDCIKMK